MIQTVTGAVDPNELGVTLVAENLLLRRPGWDLAYDSRYSRPDEYDRVRGALAEFAAAGGRTIVDTGGILLGRDVRMLADISEATGVNIVATTGMPDSSLVVGYFDFGVARAYFVDDGKRWHREAPGGFFPGDAGRPEHLGRMLANEVEIGMATPHMYRSLSRAGAIIFGASQASATQFQSYLADASAFAARATGAPVIVRVEGPEGPAVAAALVSRGIPARQVVVGGRDLAGASSDEDVALARSGHWLLFDHVGWSAEKTGLSDAERVDRILHLASDGQIERLLLSTGSVSATVGWDATAHGPAHLLVQFVPALLAAGLRQEDVDRILVDNPRQALASAGVPTEH